MSNPPITKILVEQSSTEIDQTIGVSSPNSFLASQISQKENLTNVSRSDPVSNSIEMSKSKTNTTLTRASRQTLSQGLHEHHRLTMAGFLQRKGIA